MLKLSGKCLYKASKKVLNHLEGLRRRFFCGGTDESKKISWIAWDKVLRNKKCGGQGIGSLSALNRAMLVKWRWRERTETEVKWATMVRNCNTDFTAGNNSTRQQGVWNSIFGIENDLRDMGINLSSLMQPSEDRSGWVWLLESSKIYSVRSLRKLIDGISLPTADPETEWLRWVPGKANILLWRVLTNRLATRDNLQRMGVTLSTIECPLCHSNFECLDHVMATCSTTKIISAYLVSWVDWWPGNEHTAEAIWRRSV